MVSNETETLEWRDRCDKCGAIFGEFHKGCDGRWVEESRTVTAWARKSASAGVGDAGTSTGTPEPSQAATEAHGERTGLPEYLDELREELDEQEGRANYWERKAKTYRRQMVEERAKVARAAALADEWDRALPNLYAQALRAALDAE